MHRSLPAVLLLAGLLAPAAAAAGPTALEDSTSVERWTLANGLAVVARDVPGASAVSVTLGWRYGEDDEPADRPGLSELLAELVLTGPAGDVPERRRDELESLRPEGWALRVTRRHSLLTEAATAQQLPGVIHQIAARVRALDVTEPVLRTALATVRHDLGARYFGSPEQMLYWQSREFARGEGQAGVLTRASARELDRETPKSLVNLLRRVLVPANAVLAVAGDLRGTDLHALIAAEFGALPAGARLPDPPAPRLDSVTVVVERPEVAAPVGVVALEAPALTDSTSPSFYDAMLVLGTRTKQAWGPATAPLTSRFQYSLLDDPWFVRIYPDFGTKPATPERLASRYADMVADLLAMTITRDTYEEFRFNLLWLLGGPMPPEILSGVRRDPAALNYLSGSTASRALWGDEAFWVEYRRRLDPTVTPAFGWWGAWLLDPRHQARMLLVPRR